MAYPTPVNGQITDAVTGASEGVVSALADQILVFAVGLAMQNAVVQQQQQHRLRNAITAAPPDAAGARQAADEAMRIALDAATAALDTALASTGYRPVAADAARG